jgi:hypothetical protein
MTPASSTLVFLVVFVLPTLVITLTTNFVVGWPLRDSMIAALAVITAFLLLAFITVWLRSKSKAGPLLLDCGEHPTKRMFLINGVTWFALVVLASVGALVAGVLGKTEYLRTCILVALWLAFCGPYWFIMAFSRLQICEHGIWQYVGLLNWDRIESHEWQGEENRTLVLTKNRKLAFFAEYPVAMKQPVPLEHRDAVDDLLRMYVPRCEVGEASDDAPSNTAQ